MPLGKITTIAAAAAVLALGTGAQAQEIKTLEISVQGVDFTDPEAVEAIGGKVRQAARNVCRVRGRGSVAEKLEERECISIAYKTGMEQVETKRLAALGAAPGEALAMNIRPPVRADLQR